MNQDFEARKLELEELIASNDLAEATKRLMDLSEDFAPGSEWRIESIAIKGAFSELREDRRKLGASAQLEVRTRELRYQILEVIQRISEFNRLSLKTDKNLPQKHKLDDSDAPSNITTSSTGSNQIVEQQTTSDDDLRPVFVGVNISKSQYSNTTEFRLHVDKLELKLNEITAVVGENGSGKSTLLNIISARSHCSGELSYPKLTSSTNEDNDLELYDIRRQIAYLDQDYESWQLSVLDTLRFTAAIHGSRGKKNKSEVDFIVTRLGLEAYVHHAWQSLSTGYKTRFMIARALLYRPKLLILDEPLANLDIKAQAGLLRDIRNLANSIQRPISVVLSSQHLHEVETIADNIIFLQRGEVIYNGPTKDFGSDRKENVYEIECGLLRHEIEERLTSSFDAHVESDGLRCVIHTPINITYSKLLKHLMDTGVELRYFRDISRSTRMLFTEDQ